MVGGLGTTFVLPWDSSLHLMVGGTYRSFDSASGFTARVAVSHKFGVDHSDREVKERAKAEAADPLLTKLENSKGLPPDEIYATLQQGCAKGNRQLCLLEAVNKVQRDGDRADFKKRAEELYKKTDWREGLKKLAYVVWSCATQDDWALCQEAKARVLTFYPWALASGTSFAKMFPPETPPDDFPMAALDKVPAGRNWSCFHYSAVVKTYVSSEGNTNVEAVNLGCERTKEACTQALAAAQSNANITTVGNCVDYDGMLWLFDEGMHYQEEQLCKDQRELKSERKTCVPVGDVYGPGL